MRQVIDGRLWDRARWHGVGYGIGGPEHLPFLALVFTDPFAAEDIFRGWRDLIGGDTDEHELIGIAIIEGEVPNQEPGYSVHIGGNPKPAFNAAARVSTEPTRLPEFARQVHRMPAPHSPRLAGFKEAYARAGRFQLMPAYVAPATRPLISPDLLINKTKIIFRSTSHIPQNDIDSVVFLEPDSGTRRVYLDNRV